MQEFPEIMQARPGKDCKVLVVHRQEFIWPHPPFAKLCFPCWSTRCVGYMPHTVKRLMGWCWWKNLKNVFFIGKKKHYSTVCVFVLSNLNRVSLETLYILGDFKTFNVMRVALISKPIFYFLSLSPLPHCCAIPSSSACLPDLTDIHTQHLSCLHFRRNAIGWWVYWSSCNNDPTH